MVDIGARIKAALADFRAKRGFHDLDIQAVDLSIGTNVGGHLSRHGCKRIACVLDLDTAGAVLSCGVGLDVPEETRKPRLCGSRLARPGREEAAVVRDISGVVDKPGGCIRAGLLDAKVLRRGRGRSGRRGLRAE